MSDKGDDFDDFLKDAAEYLKKEEYKNDRAEVEAREKAEFMAQAFEEGSAEWEERYLDTNKTVKNLQENCEKLKRALWVASNQLEGVSLAISLHGNNINPEFFITEYARLAEIARNCIREVDEQT